MDIPAGIKITRVHVGVLGRTDPDSQKVTNETAAFVTALQPYLDNGDITSVPHQLWKEDGWNGLIHALEYLQTASVNKRTVVKVQNE